MAFEVNLSETIQQEIRDTAEKHGFKKISFYPWYEGTGDSRSMCQARTKDPKSITFYHRFLSPASELYQVHPKLLKKVTEIVCLHERKHHQPPFFSNPHVDDWSVQKMASQTYGNHKEFAILDTLLLVYNAINFFNNNQLKKYISDYLNKFTWLDSEEKGEIAGRMSNKRFYKKRQLKEFFGLEKSLLTKIISKFSIPN